MTSISNQDSFKLKQINVSDLNNIQIKDVSGERTQGRRFTVSLGDKSTEELRFNDIFKHVQHLAKKENNIENLETIHTFLETFKNVDDTAETAVKQRSKDNLGYKINTWIHRVFNRGTHSGHIDHLEKSIQKKLGKLQNAFDALDHVCAGPEKDRRAAKLVNEYLEGNNLDKAMLTIDKMFDRHWKDALFAKTIVQYEPTKAIELARATEFKYPSTRDTLLVEIARACLNIEDLESAFDAVGGLETDDAMALQKQIAQVFMLRKDFDQSIIEICNSDITGKGTLLKHMATSQSLRNGREATLEQVRGFPIPDAEKDKLIEGVIEANLLVGQIDDARAALQFISDNNLRQQIEFPF